ncbi:MAG: hypothetical protein JJU28_09760 [Cyclobacteriaceae bacterium]|nr:hypothetical protein [Cyclobacteriaceae bacterium]
MKTNTFATVLWFMLLLLTLSSCYDKVEITRTYTVVEPVYMSTQEIRSSVGIVQPEPLKAPGKIYMLGNFLFINEPGEGVHVIDNSNPELPKNISFIKIPGNYDIAGMGNLLYADSYMDLVILDISNLEQVQVVYRNENIFQQILDGWTFDPDNGVIIDWVEVQKIEVSEGEVQNMGFPTFFNMAGNRMAVMDMAMVPQMAAPQPQVGIGGSMARFTISQNHLYTIDQNSLYTFDLSDPQNPPQFPTINVGWGIETIFPYKDMLFIGAQNGMHIYSIQNPSNPEKLSMYQHVLSCDPVVVQDTIAYVTLRGGTECRGFTNQLDIINIKDPSRPRLLVSHPMIHPHGLGIDGKTLFICEGEHGLKVFDASDIFRINANLKQHFRGFNAFDVIPYQGHLMLIGLDGLYQYTYTEGEELTLLSKLAIEKP